MAGKRDNTVVAVIGDLTSAQAARMTQEIMKAKARCAPHGRGTIASGRRDEVGALLQTGYKKKAEIGMRK